MDRTPRFARSTVPVVSAIGTLLLLTNAAVASDAPRPAEPGQIPKFTLRDPQGASHTAAEWQASKAVVLLFLGTECPVSNGYSPLMQRLADEYTKRGVACYGVHSDPSVSADQAAAHAKEYGLTFALWLDPDQVLARAVRVQTVPEAVVLSPQGSVLYRGRIDNRYALDGKRRDQPTSHELVDALESVLTGKTPAVTETKAFGCPLPKARSKPR